MKKLQSVSLLASASVLALTTAVYVPGYTAYAVDTTTSCPTATTDLADGYVGLFTATADENGIVFDTTCSTTYKVGTLNKYIVIEDGADVTLDISEAKITANGANTPIQVKEGGKLTLKGSDLENDSTALSVGSATKFIENNGELVIDTVVLNSTKIALDVVAGKVTLSNVKIDNGTISTAEGTTLTIDGEDTVVEKAVTSNGVVYIHDGTFNLASKQFSKVANVFADGGRYKTEAIASDARDPQKSLSVYNGADSINSSDDGYWLIEKTLTEDDVIFEDFTITEDEESAFPVAVVKNSATDFRYTIDLVDADGNPTPVTTDLLQDDGTGAAYIPKTNADGEPIITVEKSGVYTVTATSTFDAAVSKTVTMTVTSTMSEDTLSLQANANYGTDIKKSDTFVDGDEITLYVKGKLRLNYVLTTADVETSTANATYAVESDDTDVVTGVSTGDTYVTLTAVDTGTANVKVTATSSDGAVTKTVNLKVSVYRPVEDADFIGASVVAGVGDVLKISDLVAFSEQGQKRADKNELNVDTFSYGKTESTTNYIVDTDAGTVIMVDFPGDATNVAIVVTDGSGKEATVNATIYTLDFVISDVTDAANIIDLENGEADSDHALSLVEDGDSVILGVSDIDSNANLPEDLDVTFSYDLVDSSLATIESENITLTDNSDGTATLSGTLATTDPVLVRVRVNDSDNLYKLIAVTVTAELSAATLLIDNDEVATATLADGGKISADLELTAGEAANFRFNITSASAELTDFSVESTSANLTLDVDHESQTFTVTGQELSDAPAVITVTAYGADKNTEEFVFTLSVTVKAAADDRPVAEQTVENGIYIINSALDSGKVLDVAGASTADGANVQLYRNNTTIAQKFIIAHVENGYYTIENLLSGKLLTANGSNVEQRSATGADAQLWQIVKLDSGNVQFINKATSEYIDIAGGNTANGTNAQLYGNNGEASEQFILTTVAATADEPILADGTYIISSALASDKGLDISGADAGNGANLQLWRTNGTAAQNFTLKYKGNGFYTIYTGTGDGTKVLDVSGAGTTAGTNIDQWRDNGTIAQEWMLVKNSDGTYSLASRCNGLYLDISGASTDNGANAQLWRGNGTAAQKFYFSPVSE